MSETAIQNTVFLQLSFIYRKNKICYTIFGDCCGGSELARRLSLLFVFLNLLGCRNLGKLCLRLEVICFISDTELIREVLP